MGFLVLAWVTSVSLAVCVVRSVVGRKLGQGGCSPSLPCLSSSIFIPVYECDAPGVEIMI